MRAKEFIQESIQQEVADAIPSLYSIPELKNQDPYKQYRMGVALATARAVKNGDVEFTQNSEWNENMLIGSFSPEGDETIQLALKLMKVKAIAATSKTSDELKDTNSVSPVAKYKPTKRPSKRK